MLNHEELSALARSLHDERLLSVYVDAAVSDPKDRNVWHLALDQQLKAIRQNILGTSHQERELFEQCVRHLATALADFQASLGTLGWVGFIAGDGVRYAESLAMALPTLASWRNGPRIAPYVRALRETRPVVVVMAGTYDATIYKWEHGVLDTIAHLRARAPDEEPIHMSKTARAGYHTGVRGVAGKDETGRGVDAASKRMIADAAERAMKVAGRDGWLLAGGIPEVSVHLVHSLQTSANGRVRHVAGLDIHASDAQIAAAARAEAEVLRNASVSSVISTMIERQRAHDMATFGLSPTERVLQQKRVRDLYLTHRFIDRHAREAEDAVRHALDQGAAVEEVAGSAAERLDQLGGIAARLRYRLTATDAEQPAAP